MIEGILKVFSTLAVVSLPRFGTGWCFVLRTNISFVYMSNDICRFLIDM